MVGLIPCELCDCNGRNSVIRGGESDGILGEK